MSQDRQGISHHTQSDHIIPASFLFPLEHEVGFPQSLKQELFLCFTASNRGKIDAELTLA